jgi:hypothetical protein
MNTYISSTTGRETMRNLTEPINNDLKFLLVL